MPTCFAPGCRSGYYKTQEKRHFFRPPRNDDLRAAWDRAIPRTDRLLTPSCRLCDLHFDDADIVKVFRHVIRGEVVEIPRSNWLLAPSAVPCIFSNSPRYLLKRKAYYGRKVSDTVPGKVLCKDQQRPDANVDAPMPCKEPVQQTNVPASREDPQEVAPKLASWLQNKTSSTCCVFKCPSGTTLAQNTEGRHYFEPPLDDQLLREWERRLGRTDTGPLTRTTLVCDLHFEEGDIIKRFECRVNGEAFVLQREQWRLKPTAVPSRLLGRVSDWARVATQLEPVRFEDLASSFTTAKTTSGWKTDVSDDRILFYKLAVSEKRVVSVSRAVIVSKDLSVCVNSNGRLVPPGLLVTSIRSREDVDGLLGVVSTLRDCGGCPADQFPDVKTTLSAVKEGGVWYRKECAVLTEKSEVCHECAKLKKLMRQRQKKVPSPPKNRKAIVKGLKKKAARARLATERMKFKLRDMKKEMAVFAKALKVLPESQQTAFKEALCHFGEVCAVEDGEQEYKDCEEEDEDLLVTEDMQSDGTCSSD